MRRTKLLALAVGVVAIATVVTVLVVSNRPSDAADSPDDTTTSNLSLATVEQRDLARTTTLDGTVGRGDPVSLPMKADGTLTRLPAVGDTIASGGVLAEVDGKPIVLLTGERPAWRDLVPGMTDGEDIRQLETALAALGYAPSGMTVDDEWDYKTTTAVKAMQKALGMTIDGKLTLGKVVFTSGTVRIAEVAGVIGDSAAEAGIKVTGEAQVITTEVSANDSDTVAPGTVVDIEMPTGEHIDATVWSLGAPTANADGDVVLPVVLLADGLNAEDGLSVDVNVSTVAAAGATAVPAEALLALSEGGYAVEVADTSSATGTRLVGVDPGVFADGWVQVTGDVKPGDQVVVP